MIVKFKNIKFGEFRHVFGPAKLLSNKITANIDVANKSIFGVAGGHDKFKFWHANIDSICESVDISDGELDQAIARVVILDINNLFNTMSILEDGMDLEFELSKKGPFYETNLITIKKNTIAIKFACANIAVADAFLTDEDKQAKLGEFGPVYKFAITQSQLALIKKLAHTQTLAQSEDHITFSNKNGSLYVHNNVFDYVFEDIQVGSMPDYKFNTQVFVYIDNDNYNVTITQTPTQIDKIVFESLDRDIQFVCSLLIDAEVHDNDAIDEEFNNFFGN